MDKGGLSVLELIEGLFTSTSLPFTAALYLTSSFSLVAFVFFSLFITSAKYAFFPSCSKGDVSSLSLMTLTSDVSVSINST